MENAERIVPSLMVVDDDQGIVDSFNVLFGRDYNVITAKSGEECMELLKKRGDFAIHCFFADLFAQFKFFYDF